MTNVALPRFNSRRKAGSLSMILKTLVYIVIINTLVISSPLSFGSEDCQLNVAIEASFPSIFYQKNEGGHVGIWPDLLKSMLKQMGCQYKLVFLPAARIEVEANAGRVDVAISIDRPASGNVPADKFSSYIKGAMKKNEDREKTMPSELLARQPLLICRNGYVARKGEKIHLKSEMDYANYEIGAVYLPHLTEEAWKGYVGLPFQPKGYTKPIQGLKSVAAGRIDLFLYPEYGLQEYEALDVMPELILAHEVSPLEFRLVVFTAGLQERAYPLIEQLENSQKVLRDSGMIKSIVESYSKAQYFVWPK